MAANKISGIPIVEASGKLAGILTEMDAEVDAYARTADAIRQPLYAWYVPLWRGMRALMSNVSLKLTQRPEVPRGARLRAGRCAACPWNRRRRLARCLAEGGRDLPVWLGDCRSPCLLSDRHRLRHLPAARGGGHGRDGVRERPIRFSTGTSTLSSLNTTEPSGLRISLVVMEMMLMPSAAPPAPGITGPLNAVSG